MFSEFFVILHQFAAGGRRHGEGWWGGEEE
jgi:hypothetical protein